MMSLQVGPSKSIFMNAMRFALKYIPAWHVHAFPIEILGNLPKHSKNLKKIH